MKLLSLNIFLVFLSTAAWATPNYVDCTHASSPLAEETLGEQGFGIAFRFPEDFVVVQNFIYSKGDEKAWMDVIVDGSIYRSVADCRMKINRGVLCMFDLTLQTAGSIQPAGSEPLSNYMARLYASVIDLDLNRDLVEVRVAMDDQSMVPSHPLPYRNMIPLNNDWSRSCVGVDAIDQG